MLGLPGTLRVAYVFFSILSNLHSSATLECKGLGGATAVAEETITLCHTYEKVIF